MIERFDSSGSARHTIVIDEALLSHNNAFAEENRERFRRAGVLAVNLLSSPGSGKTALLERTLAELRGRVRMAVHVGDLQTENDAIRLAGKGAPVVQIVTGNECHLEASMIQRALAKVDLSDLDVLFIENVGNLVCPAEYDLGEGLRVVLVSVTEGEDKPLKYPVAFRGADAVMITKTEVADAVGADIPRLRENAARAAPGASILEVSARSGDGMDAWYDYILAAAGKA